MYKLTKTFLLVEILHTEELWGRNFLTIDRTHRYNTLISDRSADPYLNIIFILRIWKIKKWFGFFVFRHINLHELFNTKPILVEEQQWYYVTNICENKRVYTFPKGICPKVNIKSMTGVWTSLLWGCSLTL